MTIVFPVIELFDRLAVAEIKWERTQENHEELEWYTNQANGFDRAIISDLYDQLKQIHNKIWELESAIRQGNEEKLGLEEVGRRALLIRDWNNKRVQIKNQMASLLSCPVKEIKRDHLSE